MVNSNLTASSGWRILGASVSGTRHQRQGRYCEDQHAFKLQPDGTLLLATADGAGSATCAAEGATCAVQAAVQAASVALNQQGIPTNEQQWHTLLQNVLKAVRVAVEVQARVMAGCTISAAAQSSLQETEEALAEDTANASSAWLYQFATTLQLAIITAQWLAVTQVGDGAIVVQYPDYSLQAVTWPDHGEYINQTSFITEPTYLKRAQYKIIPNTGVRGIALFTDGLELLVLDLVHKVPYAPFFTPLFTFASQRDVDEKELKADLTAFLASEQICARTDDDKTLLLGVWL
ncbi:PP2C family serine/threonine-protein phosphatase [Dictyobacter formicarum]|uniref:PPM-type phosphatase domain-containing protein n=1 Tax=Dictyobacter formicarum TaxID=2778368 RepID=A0ABQ3VHR5_9CHLR|nr:PP2C family serine/threonine-protein phosphatase [Dictyobacter formicarum]GHO85221.1 hypothetical protein KSZ_32270 [Dictyobacter formicarum]